MMLLSDKSVYAVTGLLDNGLWSKTKEGEWFAKGRDEIPNALLSEHTKKYAVHLRGPLAQVPALKNQQLQILPVGNEFSDQKGAIVSYRITFNSKAVQGAKVINDDGLVTLPLRNQGLNVVAAIYDEKSTNLNVFDKTEHLATLSFFLPHTAE
jgi:nickel transport protein